VLRQIAIIAAVISVIALLAGIFIVLVHLGAGGLSVNVTGNVGLNNPPGGIDLSMKEPVNLVATGPDNKPVPADLSIFRCPKCGGTMLPVRINVLNGEITWKCTECGYTIKGDGEQSP